MRALPRVVLTSLLGLFLSLPAFAQVIQINSNVAANTTWGPTGTIVGSTFRIVSNIAISAGVTLTIQPGVVVKFDSQRSLTVNGALRAIGTASDSIVFTSIKDDNNGAGDTNGDGNSTIPNASDWGTLSFPDASVDFASRLDHCDIRFGGYSQVGALTFASSSDSVTNSVIRRSYYGLDCSGSAAPVLANTRIEASTTTPIVLDFTAQPIFSNLVFSSSDNLYDAIGLKGGALSGTATLSQRGATVGVTPVSNVTYVLLSNLTINSGASLTILPGVVIKPLAGLGITVGGNLTMNGTVTDTITVSSIADDNVGLPGDTNNNGSNTAPARGDWGRISFSQGSTGSLQYCRLRFGTNTQTQAMVQMTNANIPIENSELSEASHAIGIFGLATPALTNLNLHNCSSTPTLMSVVANPTFTNVNFTANAITALGIEGEDVAIDARLPVRNAAGYTNITYYVMNGAIAMKGTAVLTIDPGIVVKNESQGGGISIDGALVADGKPDSLIVFTSVRDDQYGNPPDTNGDGAITAPDVADWGYIRFLATTNDATSKLDHCRITYGSYEGTSSPRGLVWLTSASPSITNTVCSKGSYGIRLDGDSAPTIATCSFSSLDNTPIIMSAASNPLIAADNAFATNGYNAIGLLSETLAENATIRYRPGVGSPTFAYLPVGTITVGTGVTLAIEPGVVVKPSGNFSVLVVNGALNVVGSNAGAGRVVFTSRRDDNPVYGGDTTPNDGIAPAAADWGRILFNDTAVDAQCVVRNALFKFGSTGNDAGAISTASASPKIANCEFYQNRTALTFAGNSQSSVDSCIVLNSTYLPIVSSLIADPQLTNITLVNNQYTALGILGETISQDVRTSVRSIAGISNINYVPASNITIGFGAKWTIDPGVVIKLGRVTTDPTGTQIGIDGALVADGKPDSLVVFTSLNDDAYGQDVKDDAGTALPAAGQWQYVSFNAISNDAATVLDHVVVRYGGSSSSAGMQFVNAAPTLTNCRFESNLGGGVSIEGSSTPAFTNCQFSDASGPALLMSLVSDPSFTNCTFSGNTYDALGVISETLAQDALWKVRAVSGKLNMPYVLQSTLTVGPSVTLTMQPGVRVKLTSVGGISVQHALIAEGRSDPESLIVFTSHRDDFYGGDTNNDGATTSPAAGNWTSVTIANNASDAQVRFLNCVFRFGGVGATAGALRCVSSSPTVDSTIFAYNTVGISAEVTGNPLVRGCSIFGNSSYGINNTGPLCVSAENTWWGAASGPNDNSSAPDVCILGLNAGGGDRVSNNVDYVPFAISGIQTALLGDVSLNGQVLAYDASLVLQSLVSLIVLSPLQTLVADVSGVGGTTAFDATLILQYVTGAIPAFPANSNLNFAPEADRLRARAVIASMGGRPEVSLGVPERTTAGWDVPVRVTGVGALHALELRLAGSAAGRLTGVSTIAEGVMTAHHSQGSVAAVALASSTPLAEGDVARLVFQGDESPVDLMLGWSRSNEIASDPTQSRPSSPVLTRFAPPSPNPAVSGARIRLELAAGDAGASVAMRMYDLAGRLVRRVETPPLSAGGHDLNWDLTDEEGRRVRAGVYLVRLTAGSRQAVHRLVVVH